MALGAVSGRADVPRSGDLEGGDAGKKISKSGDCDQNGIFGDHLRQTRWQR